MKIQRFIGSNRILFLFLIFGPEVGRDSRRASGVFIYHLQHLASIAWYKVVGLVVTIFQQAGKRKDEIKSNKLFFPKMVSLCCTYFFYSQSNWEWGPLATSKAAWCFKLGLIWLKIKGRGGWLTNGWMETERWLAVSSPLGTQYECISFLLQFSPKRHHKVPFCTKPTTSESCALLFIESGC